MVCPFRLQLDFLKADYRIPQQTGGASTPNFSRPGVSITPAPASKRASLTGALKGLHRASEAIRSTVNAGIAPGMHGTAEEERMREEREQGVNEWGDEWNARARTYFERGV